jgi:uncharacterized protein (TIRG00374 family)
LKKFLLISLKILLAGALLYWLYHQQWLDFSPLQNLQWTAQTWLYFAIGALCFFAGMSIISLRLWLLLRNRQFAAPYKDVLQITCISSLVGTFFPGMVGNDVLKVVFFCSRVEERRIDAFVAVVMDRFIGLYALFLLAALTSLIALFSGAVQLPGYILWIAPSAWFILTLIGLIIRSQRVFKLRIVQAVFHWLPATLQNLVEATRAMLCAKTLLLQTTLLSLVNHIFNVMAIVFVAWVLKDELNTLLYFVFTPQALFLNAVPLTPGGLGIAESAFAFLFQAAGSDNGALIGLLGRLLLYSVFLVTGLISLIFLRWRGVPIAIMQAEEQVDEEKLLQQAAHVEDKQDGKEYP